MTTVNDTALGMRKTLNGSYDEALASVPAALAAEGFGVLTEIDIQATLQRKLGASFRPYKILGACNPPFAHQALQADLEIGLLLPCNVVIYEDDAGRAVVLALDPVKLMALADSAQLTALAEAVRERLLRALARLE